jgi:hypothetical protein
MIVGKTLKYTFKLNDGSESYGSINLDKVTHFDLIRQTEEEGDSTVTKEAFILYLDVTIQKQITVPTYSPGKKSEGGVPKVSGARTEIIWTQKTIIIEEPSEIESLKNFNW